MKIITEPKSTLTNLSMDKNTGESLILNSEKWVDFDLYVEQNCKPSHASTDTLLYNTDNSYVDAIEFKNSAFQDLISPNPKEKPTLLRAYIEKHKKLPRASVVITMMIADKDELFFKKYLSTRNIVECQQGKNILVVNKAKTKKKEYVPPFLQDKHIVDNIMQELKDNKIIPVIVLYEKQFEEKYCVGSL